MRYSVVENGVVTNTIIADESFVGDDPRYIASDEAGIGWAWDGAEFTPPDVVIPPGPEPEPRLVRKALIIDRLHAAGKLEDAYATLQSSSLYDRQRWEVRDAVYYNDPTTLAVLNAIGADPDVILAPE